MPGQYLQPGPIICELLPAFHEAAEKEVTTNNGDVALAKLAQMDIDLLLLAYSRAEGMDPKPGEKYSELRTYWG